MVSNRRVLLVECQFCHGCVIDQPLIVAEDIRCRVCGINWYSKHILSLNLRCSISSMHCFMAMNLDEKALVSTVCCCLLIHLTGSLLTSNMYPVCDFLVILFVNVMTALPRGGGILCGMSSLAS